MQEECFRMRAPYVAVSAREHAQVEDRAPQIPNLYSFISWTHPWRTRTRHMFIEHNILFFHMGKKGVAFKTSSARLALVFNAAQFSFPPRRRADPFRHE